MASQAPKSNVSSVGTDSPHGVDRREDPSFDQTSIAARQRPGETTRRAAVRLPILGTGSILVLAAILLICLIPSKKPDPPARAKPSHVLVSSVAAADALAFSPDGRCLAWVGRDGTLASLDLQAKDHPDSISRLPLEPGEMGRCLAFSLDGSLRAVGLHDGRVKLWDTRSRTSRFLMVSEGSIVRSVAFAPEQTVLATGGADSVIKIWDLPAGESRISLQGHRASIGQLAFSPDGRVLASSDTEGLVILWDWSNARRRATFRPRSESWPLPPVQLVFAPDGKTLVTTSGGSRITLWDVATARRIASLGEETLTIMAVAMSPDGKLLATAGLDRLIECWDLNTRERGAVLRGHEGHISALAFSPDGRQLVSGGTDGTLRMWLRGRDYKSSW
jgi:WD40 repeat protein